VTVDWPSVLRDGPALREAGLFVAEGRIVIERLLAGAGGGIDAIVSVLATPPAVAALALDARLGDRLDVRSPREMEAVTGFNFHRGLIALVRRTAMPALDDLLAPTSRFTADSRLPTAASEVPDRRASATATSDGEATATSGGEVYDCRLPTPDCRASFVVLEHLVDVDNVGSCFRNARAFGAAAVLVDERCADPLYRKAVRTSQGAVLEVPWASASMSAILSALDKHGVATVGLTPRGGEGARIPQRLDDVLTHIDRGRPVALLVGNEGSGLSGPTLDACTHLACIPMAEGADSINVATALAVALYQVAQR
jgi:tRNA G18 (ribose-2'-O)-methylase SpoU